MLGTWLRRRADLLANVWALQLLDTNAARRVGIPRFRFVGALSAHVPTMRWQCPPHFCKAYIFWRAGRLTVPNVP
eukprot:8673915-Alexandrium_andersonii.AAC.1